MRVDELMQNGRSWLALEPGADVVISSRVRLTRNLTGEPFPGRADEAARVRVWNEVHRACVAAGALTRPLFLDLGSLSETDKAVLLERHLISPEMVERGRGGGLIAEADERLAIMVNEEDHLRLQAMSSGLDLAGCWERIDAVDSALERQLPYAFSPRLGYLTACPTNVGTGMRAGAMLHLPGLRMIGEIEAVTKGLNRIGIEVRGLRGEGTEAAGDLFQVSNRPTLGIPEQDVLQGLAEIVRELAMHERNARARLWERRRAFVLDTVGRAYGIILHGHVVASREAVELLSAIRLGRSLGLVRHVEAAQLTDLMLKIQPGHLQKRVGRDLEADERDQMRAQVLRDELRGVAVGTIRRAKARRAEVKR